MNLSNETFSRPLLILMTSSFPRIFADLTFNGLVQIHETFYNNQHQKLIVPNQMNITIMGHLIKLAFLVILTSSSNSQTTESQDMPYDKCKNKRKCFII